jgi:transposase-like protein
MAKHAAAHGSKMCALTCCSCNLDLKKVAAIVTDAKYVCKVCGHVAAKSANLCQPVALK